MHRRVPQTTAPARLESGRQLQRVSAVDCPGRRSSHRPAIAIGCCALSRHPGGAAFGSEVNLDVVVAIDEQGRSDAGQHLSATQHSLSDL